MPTARLTYRLPEEESEHRDALQGTYAKLLIWEIDQHCRALLKHGDPDEETRALAEQIRMMIRAADRVTLE
jgi:hypothetical protein